MATLHSLANVWHIVNLWTTCHHQSMGIVDDEQNAARADLVEAARLIAEGQAKLRSAVQRAVAAKLQITEIARLGDVSRQTVYYWSKDD